MNQSQFLALFKSSLAKFKITYWDPCTGQCVIGECDGGSGGTETLTTLNSVTLLPGNILQITYTGEDGIPQVKTASLASLADTETITTIINTIVGHKIGSYNNEAGASVDINESITTISGNTYTNEAGTAQAIVQTVVNTVTGNNLTTTVNGVSSTSVALPADIVTTLTGTQATGKTIGTYTNEAAAVVDIKETITSFASITNGYQFTAEDGTVYPFTFVFDNSTPSSPQLLVNYGATTVSTIPLNSYDVNISTTGGFTLNPLTDVITITETDGETHTIDLSYLRSTLTSTDGSVQLVTSVNPDGSTNYDLGVKVYTNETQAVPYTGVELPLITGVNIGDAVTTNFTNGVAHYTFDGTDWVVDFFTPAGFAIDTLCDATNTPVIVFADENGGLTYKNPDNTPYTGDPSLLAACCCTVSPIVSADANNDIIVGSDGGAYLNIVVQNAHIVATTAYDDLNPLTGWVAPSSPVAGNTVEVKFTDGTVGNYTFDGSVWVQNFSEQNYINPVDFGAIPNSTTDATAAFQSAVNLASILRKPVRPTNGTYYLSNVLLNDNVVMLNDGCKFINNYTSGPATNIPIFKAEGTTGISTTTTAVPIWGAILTNFEMYDLYVTDASIFSVNEYVKVEYVPVSGIDFLDFNQIRSIDLVNNKLTMYKATNIQDFPIGTIVTKINPKFNIKIEGGEYIGQSGHLKNLDPIISFGGNGIDLIYAQNVIISNISGYKNRASLLNTKYCYNVTINGINTYNNNLFGLLLENSSNIKISNVTIEECGQGGLIISSLKEANISNVNITNNGLNTGSGDNIQGYRIDQVNFNNINLYRSNCYHIWLKGWSRNVTLTNVIAKKGITGAFYVTQGCENISFNNCIAEDNTWSFAIGDATSLVKSVRINSCRLHKNNTGNWNIIVQNAQDVHVTNNHIQNVINTNTVLIVSSDRCIYTGNIIQGNEVFTATNSVNAHNVYY